MGEQGDGRARATILVVCTGNVCRSPLLERLLQRGLDEAYGPGVVEVRSAGTGALVDHAMDERAAALLTRLGGDPDGFLARRLTPAMVAPADLVLAATLDHRAQVVRAHPRALKRTFTLGELASILRHLDPAERPVATDAPERLQELVAIATAHRGTVPPEPWEDFDLVDPYRRGDEVYDAVEEAVRQDLPVVLDALGVSPDLGGRP